MDRRQYVIAKFGSLERAQRLYEAVSRSAPRRGIKFDFDRIVRTPNTGARRTACSTPPPRRRGSRNCWS
jgi:predicted DsbA family dithiol-disulfide isomerase